MAGRKRPGDESVLASYQSEQHLEDAKIYDPTARTYSTGDDGSSIDGRRVRPSTIKQGGRLRFKRGSCMYDENFTLDDELTDEDEQPPPDSEINNTAKGKVACG